MFLFVLRFFSGFEASAVTFWPSPSWFLQPEVTREGGVFLSPALKHLLYLSSDLQLMFTMFTEGMNQVRSRVIFFSTSSFCDQKSRPLLAIRKNAG